MVFSFKKKPGAPSDSAMPSATKLAKPSIKTKSPRKKIKLLQKNNGFKSTSGAKYGLIVGDEGAILIYIVDKVVKSRNFIASANSDNLKEFAAIIAKDPAAPIFFIVDSIDQSFIQQSLPPISALGIRKLIKRRLDRDLGTDVVKGYILLERDKEGRKDWNYLMVSLENTPHLKLWFEFIESLDNRVSGIYLLSVETENIVKNLDAAMDIRKHGVKEGNKSKWKFFITHNKIGGFRQVVLKNDRIIFTRLTHPAGDSNSDVVAGSIEQEILSTIEYMKRMSFNHQDGLDIYVIASAEINNSLELIKTQANNVYKFTPFEVSEFLGISGAAQPTDQFGDAILTAAISCSKTHKLTLFLPKIKQIDNLFQIIKYQRLISIITIIILLAYGVMESFDLMDKYSQIEKLTQDKTEQQTRLNNIKEEIKKSGIEVRKINDTVLLYQQIKHEFLSPIPVLARIRPAIDPSVTVHSIVWDSKNSAAAGAPPAPPVNPNMPGNIDSITIVLRFPDTTNTNEALQSLAKQVQRSLREKFPEYNVSYKNLPASLSEKNKIGDVSFDDKAKTETIAQDSLEATIVLVRNPNVQLPPNAVGAAIPAIETATSGKR